MVMQFSVHNHRARLKLIPYVGCKSGFSHIFDALIPDDPGRVYDLFGGGGGFTFYACNRFGSENVTYNDHNPVLVNLIESLKRDPEGLHSEYQVHYAESSPEYYLGMRKMDLGGGIAGAGRFLYLAKNAFSGKIRFNSKNEFNCPMRKNAKCPRLGIETLRLLSDTIQDLEITGRSYSEYAKVGGSFVYLDPPYMNNPNSHYNATVPLEDFAGFVRGIQGANKVMISEQNSPESLMLSEDYAVFAVTLNRSLQYYTQENSKEIVAINYDAPGA
ncbi:MAG: DNA adenine methylase [Nitrosopumilus sp. H8]|nr:MAG: DNA adenine methylase [Nitrosopumilus sp. H8]